MMKRRAVFLDRDGTLVHPYHYPSRVEHLRLYDKIGPALRTLQGMGFALVIITNQSGIARGYFTERDLEHMHNYLRAELATSEVHFDGIYYCPHHPDGAIPELAIRCNCRKPQPGMPLQAADELNLDLDSSWLVGDTLDDVEAGKRVGCHTVLVDLATESQPGMFMRTPTFVAPNTIDALRIIQTVTRLEPELNLIYRPASWQLHNDAEYSIEEVEGCSRSSIQQRL